MDEIEYIIRILPESVSYLLKKGVCGINCGDPVLGTLQSVAKEKGFTDQEIGRIVNELNELLFL